MFLKFKLRRPNEKLTSLYVEFKKNGKRIMLFPGKTVQTEHWHEGYQACKKSHPSYAELNLFLRTWKDDVEKIILHMEIRKEFISKDSIQAELDKLNPNLQKQDEITDFIAFMDKHIKNKKASKKEVQKLQQTRKHVIIAFDLITAKKLAEWESFSISHKARMILQPDYKLQFNRINLHFIEDFRDYFYQAKYRVLEKGVTTYRNYKVNTIDKQIKGLKQFLLAAIDAKYVEHFTWRTIKSTEVDVDSVYTDFREIELLKKAELSHPTEILVRDKYVLNTFLGMRYSDLNKLASHLFKKRNINGKEYMIYTGRQQKTDMKIEFAIHPMAQNILEKYNYKIPKLSAEEYNKVLKRVAFKAGLTNLERIREIRGYEKIEKDVPKYELMSSHAGRRSFCTNFCEAGVAIQSIMAISGHKTEEEFRKYIKKPAVNIEVVAAQIHAIKGLNTISEFA